jgi:hypothetical protein
MYIIILDISFIIFFGSNNNGVFKHLEGQPSFHLFWISVFSHYKWSADLEMQAESLCVIQLGRQKMATQHNNQPKIVMIPVLQSRSRQCQKQNEARYESS